MGIYHSQQLALAGGFSESDLPSLKQVQAWPAWFQEVPPERVGLNGEYDYYGLQRRVEAAFKEQVAPEDLAHLSVSQRGRVIILQGHVPSESIRDRLVDIAISTKGTYRVEANWVVCEAVEPMKLAV